MGKKARVNRFIGKLGEIWQELPDKRAGRHNQQYEMGDAVPGAFAVFFTQSASFLAYQRDLQRRKGQNNAESNFCRGSIPSDNQVRNMQDTAPATAFAAGYDWLWSQVESEGQPAGYKLLGGRLLMGIDGIQFFSSTKIQCDQYRHSQVVVMACMLAIDCASTISFLYRWQLIVSGHCALLGFVSYDCVRRRFIQLRALHLELLGLSTVLDRRDGLRYT